MNSDTLRDRYQIGAVVDRIASAVASNDEAATSNRKISDDEWKYMLLAQSVANLAKRAAQPLENGHQSESAGDGLACECIMALGLLLEAIGVHAEQRDLVLERLTVSLVSPRMAGVNQGRLLGVHDQGDLRLVETLGKPALHKSTLCGEVIEHTPEALVVRFDVGGIDEEREFYWKEITAKPEDLPVGSAVMGFSELVKCPLEAETDDDAEVDRQIGVRVRRKLEAEGLGTIAVEDRVMPRITNWAGLDDDAENTTPSE